MNSSLSNEHVGNGVVGRNSNQKMYVITSSIDAKSDASDLTDDTAEIGVQILFEIGLDQSAALFRAEDEMHKQICGCVRHSFLAPLRGFLVLCLPPTAYAVGCILFAAPRLPGCSPR